MRSETLQWPGQGPGVSCSVLSSWGGEAWSITPSDITELSRTKLDQVRPSHSVRPTLSNK